MNAIDTAAGVVFERVQNVSAKSTLIANKTDFFYKATKVAAHTLTLIKVMFQKLAESPTRMLDAFKGSIQILEGVFLFSTIADFIVPNNKDKYFLTDKSNSPQKVAEKVFLAFHQLFKTINAAVMQGLACLAGVVKYAVGNISVFRLFTDGFYVVSNAFGIWEAGNKIQKAQGDSKLAYDKIMKWNDRPAEIAFIRMGDTATIESQKVKYVKSIEVKEALVQKKHAEIVKLEAQIPLLDSGNTTETNNQIVNLSNEVNTLKNVKLKLEKRIDICRNRLNYIEAGKYDVLADELKASKTEAKIEAKVSKWDAIKQKAQSAQVSSWMKIFTAALKIIIISLSIAFTIACIATPAIALTFAVLCLAADGVGLARAFYDVESPAVKV